MCSIGRSIALVVCALSTVLASGQVPLCKADTIPGQGGIAFAEETAEFPGGEVAMYKFLSENFQKVHPKEPCTKGYFQFLVGADGKVSDVCMLRRTCPDLEAEGARVIMAMPTWKPAVANGVAVPVLMRLPITIEP